MARWLETDSLANQNIASGLAIGAYTADADRLVLCQFLADQVAGNGDYDFWLTLQVAGSGSHYRFVPKTTATVASGVTAIGGQSILVAVRSGDVVTCWLDGLAGDTTTPDTAVRWFEVAATGVLLDGILADTDELQQELADGGRTDVLIDAAAAAPSAEAVGSQVRTELTPELARIDVASSTLSTVTTAQVKAEADAALTDYDGPTKAELDLAVSPLSTAAALAAVDTLIDAIISDLTRVLTYVGTGTVSVTYPILTDATVVIEAGDDYDLDEDRQLDWTDSGDTWPDLTSATIKIYVGDVLTKAGSVITPTGAGKKVRVELTKTETEEFIPGAVYWYRVIATLANGHVVTLVPRSRWLVNKVETSL